MVTGRVFLLNKEPYGFIQTLSRAQKSIKDKKCTEKCDNYQGREKNEKNLIVYSFRRATFYLILDSFTSSKNKERKLALHATETEKNKRNGSN